MKRCKKFGWTTKRRISVWWPLSFPIFSIFSNLRNFQVDLRRITNTLLERWEAKNTLENRAPVSKSLERGVKMRGWSAMRYQRCPEPPEGGGHSTKYVHGPFKQSCTYPTLNEWLEILISIPKHRNWDNFRPLNAWDYYPPFPFNRLSQMSQFEIHIHIFFLA